MAVLFKGRVSPEKLLNLTPNLKNQFGILKHSQELEARSAP
jgi:hypothetical protein